MQLPGAPDQYDPSDQSQMRGTLEREDKKNLKRTEALSRLLFASPDGTRYYLSVSNAGATVWTAA